MRENKFRGKRLDNGEWVYGGVTTYGEHAFIVRAELQISESDNMYFSTTGIEVIPATVGQYTGLKDCKSTEEYPEGQEIYEGGIVRIRESEYDAWAIYKVKYHADRDYPAFDTEPSIDCDSNGLSHAMACCEIEVISNIPDPLKEVTPC